MLSFTGYTRRHWPHLRLSPFSLNLCASGALQSGHTSMSSKSWEIIRDILRQWAESIIYALVMILGPRVENVVRQRLKI